MYRLKKNVADFTVVDGPLAGRTFRAGKVYAEIPPQEKQKFEESHPGKAVNGDTMQHHVPIHKPAPAAKGDTMQHHVPLSPKGSDKQAGAGKQ